MVRHTPCMQSCEGLANCGKSKKVKFAVHF